MKNPTQSKPSMPKHVKLIFALIIIAAFLDVIDFSVVNVAIPTIRTQFGASLADSQWIISAYGITMAGLLLLSGRAGDIYGQKKLFVAGVVLFALTSLAGGLAPSLLILIIFRLIQGIGAAISSVTAFAIFIALFPEGKERNKAMGIFVAVVSAGFAAGSIAGGVLTTYLGWRSVLFINVPIGLIAALLIWIYLPEDKPRVHSQLDLPGAVTITSGIMLLVYALTISSNAGTPLLQIVVPLILSIIILIGFFVIESKSKAPLIPLNFLRRNNVFNANLVSLIIAASSGGLGFIITIYLQQVLNFSALNAGFAFLPPSLIFFFVGGWGTSWFMEKLGAKRVLVLSSTLVTLGLLSLLVISAKGSYWAIVPGMLLWSLGASIGFPALSIAAFSGTKPGEEGLASGLITTSQRLGFPLGLAILLTVASLGNPSSGTTSPVQVVTGFRYALIAGAILAAIAVAFSFRIKIQLPQTKPPEGINLEFGEADIA